MTQQLNSAQERLRTSRNALIRQIASKSDSEFTSAGSHYAAHRNEGLPSNAAQNPILSLLTQGFQVWWRRHPSKIAVDIGRNYLDDFAARKPLVLLGIAAGAGAAAVVFKPWRLMSFTGLAFAALKSTHLTRSLGSVFTNNKK
jgi:hypothetical protein